VVAAPAPEEAGFDTPPEAPFAVGLELAPEAADRALALLEKKAAREICAEATFEI
jgi:hypothetical protein